METLNNRRDRLSDEDYIKVCESAGLIDPNCKMCQELFYKAIKEGKYITDVFAPRHKPLDSCKSGKYPHCTCDTCF